MSLEKNKATIIHLFESINKRDLNELEELIAPDFVDRALQLRGLESLKQLYTMTLNGFPDWHDNIEDMIAEGDKVWVRFKTTGTHKGVYRGVLAPTGNKITLTGVLIYRIVNSKVVEKESVYDQLDFLKQLGLIEYTEKAKKLFPENVK